jgi:hypothetical protein
MIDQFMGGWRLGTGDDGVSLYLNSHLKNTLVTKSSRVGVEHIFVEIRFPHKTLLVGSVYKPPNTSVVYYLLGAQGYGLGALKEMFADILPNYDRKHRQHTLLDGEKYFF